MYEKVGISVSTANTSLAGEQHVAQFCITTSHPLRSWLLLRVIAAACHTLEHFDKSIEDSLYWVVETSICLCAAISTRALYMTPNHSGHEIRLRHRTRTSTCGEAVAVHGIAKAKKASIAPPEVHFMHLSTNQKQCWSRVTDFSFSKPAFSRQTDNSM
ncbi:hypothetical protein BU25DRAFT_230893 [Macroventuria anomochaeta]|uniref:Uncharacterized protein n=1 Tax=Macroventuria anomochaeta TaxID=301207 RepID=A0ACB6RIR8_9PLEO|nr:uncharacterized protein BU25DRAFT_230893 [Macroventuria anomochaeta]KAF2621791.1 hypothetical protein BU25DRAFT_230893 [Macroventuria anomochaeta]